MYTSSFITFSPCPLSRFIKNHSQHGWGKYTIFNKKKRETLLTSMKKEENWVMKSYISSNLLHSCIGSEKSRIFNFIWKRKIKIFELISSSCVHYCCMYTNFIAYFFMYKKSVSEWVWADDQKRRWLNLSSEIITTYIESWYLNHVSLSGKCLHKIRFGNT